MSLKKPKQLLVSRDCYLGGGLLTLFIVLAMYVSTNVLDMNRFVCAGKDWARSPQIKLQTTLSLTQKNVLPERKIYLITDFVNA